MKKVFILLFSFTLLVSCTPVKIEVKSKGIVLRDETIIHYREAGAGPVLVLIHGLGSSSEVWSKSLYALSRAYRVIAIDLPGYGKSDKPKADYSVEYHAGVVKEFIDSLGVGKVVLAGNSLGGWIAALVALENPERVNRLILIDSAGLQNRTGLSVNLNPGTKEEQRDLLLALVADQSLVTDKLIADQWEYRKDIRATVQAVQKSLTIKLPLLEERLKDIKMPTLIIWGKQDRLIPLTAAEQFNRGISGSKLIVIEEAGHLPQMEQPIAFSRAVKGFVKSW